MTSIREFDFQTGQFAGKRDFDADRAIRGVVIYPADGSYLLAADGTNLSTAALNAAQAVSAILRSEPNSPMLARYESELTNALAQIQAMITNEITYTITTLGAEILGSDTDTATLSQIRDLLNYYVETGIMTTTDVEVEVVGDRVYVNDMLIAQQVAI